MKKSFFSVLLLILGGFSTAQAQQMMNPLKQILNIQVTPLGDAHLQISMTLPASNWDVFKQNYGNNPDMLKRQMQRALPAYFLKNFNYQDDAMKRTYTLAFDALGVGKVDQEGKWVINWGIKNADITKITDTRYLITGDYNVGGNLVRQEVHLELPSSASHVKQDQDSFGDPIFTYAMGGIRNWFGALQIILGLALLIAGGILFVQNRNAARKSSKPAPNP